MQISPIQFTAFEITQMPGLDPIRVIVQDLNPGVGRIIIECYSQAWSCFWPGMGSKTTAEFFVMCEGEYLSEKLHTGPPLKKPQRQYLLRVIKAVQEGLSSFIESAPASPHQESITEFFAEWENALNHKPHLHMEVGYTRPTDYMVHIWDGTSVGIKNAPKIITSQGTLEESLRDATIQLKQFLTTSAPASPHQEP